ncbi:MAG: hypothetical protein IJU35_02080 [Paludibacteraceae bacterium]|nr:hypothetical protein [Paludibacteraceae bacterium]
MPAHKLTFRHIRQETAIILLFLVYRLLLLGYVLIVCHYITQYLPASLT